MSLWPSRSSSISMKAPSSSGSGNSSTAKRMASAARSKRRYLILLTIFRLREGNNSAGASKSNLSMPLSKTCSPCSSGQHTEFCAYVLRHHQDQPRARPVAVGTECHVDDRRASLLPSGQEIPAPRLCRNARPSAFIGDGRRRHDGGKGHAVSQGRILIPLEEGMRSLGRGLAG